MASYLECEKSILNAYKSAVWRRFVRGIRVYRLIDPGDKIAVCISGGKDSMLMAKCLQLLQRHWPIEFGLEFIVMDPGYAPENRLLIEKNAQTLGIPVKIFESDVFAAMESMQAACFMCARMRRGVLYKLAREAGCNKIALGHHFDDVIETTLMSVFYGGEFKTMMPKLRSTSFPDMEVIRPMYLVKEADIKAWAAANGMSFLRCACRVTWENEQEDTEVSSRQQMKLLIERFREINPNIDGNIFASAQNVNLDTILGYQSTRKGTRVSFLDEY
ncbi:MAG: ATP-binding protein [Bacillota bacterium]